MGRLCGCMSVWEMGRSGREKRNVDGNNNSNDGDDDYRSCRDVGGLG